MKKNIFVLSLLACALSFTSCSDEDINQKSYNSVEVNDYYNTEADFTSALGGVYYGFTNSGYYSGSSSAADLIAIGDVMGDNLIINPNGRNSGQKAHLWQYNSNTTPTDLYSSSYNIITRANIILSKIDNLEDGDFKNNVIAQAKAVRALAHFEVARTYAEIPTQAADASSTIGIAYVDTYDPTAYPSRDATIGETYTKIIADLEAAIPYLSTSLVTTEINKFAAEAILGKVYLYNGNYTKAIEYLQPVVDGVTPATQSQLSDLWTSKASNGVLFEIPFINATDPAIGTNYSQGSTDSDIIIEYGVDKAFYALYDQKTEPERISAYFKTFNKTVDKVNIPIIAVNKYITGTVLLGVNNGRYSRVEEAILNLAEAQYLSGDSGSALTTLNKLRDVRYSTYTGGESGSALFDAIQLERRKELAFESGDRWFTLKRLQGVSGISSAYTSGIQRSGNGYEADGSGSPSGAQTLPAGDYRWQLPIPQTVLNLNKNMTQTPGY
ncbi:RagB/SusD family nutrient uptake outer membrane protein [Chishuiella sp.]|uniref:RagB/SusD family nutrient uptake outer membrane protein n=1 Tax=Chishuiella sp. TaxID=1969467 RepID=UPI0028A5AEAD|nr:RagB/SusD family nutrient uptake outer membrane protein [Chishuiella sp.]